MNLYNLQYFQCVANEENMTKAAEKLHISQPALSKAIKHLEESVGVKLFERSGRNIKLNEYGDILLKHVNKAFSEIDEGTRIIKDKSGLSSGEIKVAVTFPHVFPKLLSEFIKIYPEIKMKQMQCSSNQLIDMLENNQVDFGISTLEIQREGIIWKSVLVDDIYLTVSKEHPLAHKKSIRLDEVKDEKLIGLVENYSFRTITDIFFEQAGVVPNYYFEFEESSSILELVSRNYGVSLSPGQTIKNTTEEIVSIPISYPKCQRTVGIAYKKDHYFSKAAKAFMEFSETYLKESLN